MKVSHPHWIQVQMGRIADSTKRHDSGVGNQGDINSHDNNMIAYESNESGTPSTDISFPNDVDSQSNEIAENNSVNPTLDVEVVPLSRSARERKQTFWQPLVVQDNLQSDP